MEPSFWGDTPENAEICFNNRRQLSAALRCLLDRECRLRLLAFEADDPGVPGGIFAQLAWLVAGVARVPVDVCWFAAYPNSGFRDLGLSIRRFLLDLWRKRSFSDAGVNEYLALSFEIEDAASSSEYYEINLAALSSRVAESNVLLVLDCLNVQSLRQMEELQRLVHAFLAGPSSGLRGCLSVVRPGLLSRPDFRLSSPVGSLRAALGVPTTMLHAPVRTEEADSLIRETAAIVHALVRLNQPVQERVFKYIALHSQGSIPQLKEYLEGGLVSPLALNRFQLAQDLVDKDSRRPTQFGLFEDTIPNGAKILSFQPPERLLAQHTSVGDVSNVAEDSTILVDLFALAVNQKRSGDPKAADTLRELSLYAANKDVLRESEVHTRSLLHYCSQLIVTRPKAFGMEFFGLLENLSFGFAEFLHARYGDDDRLIEASRVLTNVGFVFDQMARLNGRRWRIEPVSKRVSAFAQAAAYLTPLAPTDMRRWAEVRYFEGWQLWDAGQTDRSLAVFQEGARMLMRAVAAAFPRDRDVEITAQEFLMISLALAPGRELPHEVLAHIEKMLETYGSSFSAQSLTDGMRDGQTLIDGPPGRRASADTTIVCCYSDLHIALLAAHALRLSYNRLPRIVCLPNGGGSASQVKSEFRGELAILIGAPDTPGGIGEFVSQSDIELVRLFQFQMADNFGISTKIPLDGCSAYVLSGCGLIGNLKAWRRFLDQCHSTLKKERSLMDDLIREFLIDPLVSATESMVFQDLVRRIVRHLKRKKPEAQDALNRLRNTPSRDLAPALAALDPDVKSALAEAASGPIVAEVLSDSIENLRMNSLDYNQIRAIAAAACELADHLHRHAPSASRQEISLGAYSLSFRNYRSEIDGLREQYLRRGVVEHEKLNDLTYRLALALRHFQEELATENGGVKTDRAL